MALRVGVVTSAPASAEPRAPRHAVAVSDAIPDADVLFIDCAPAGSMLPEPEILRAHPQIRRKTIPIAHARSAPLRRAATHAAAGAGKLLFRLTGLPLPIALGNGLAELTSALSRERLDVVIAHNIETLLPAAAAAKQSDAKLVFDCMEFYSDMGAAQSRLTRRLIRQVEKTWLPRCALVLASSDQLADALAREYDIRRPLPVYNMPATIEDLPAKDDGALHLYWRNAVIGLGERGLDDALTALPELPDDVVLNLQGRLPVDGGAAMRRRIADLGVTGRVVFHPPFAPHRAVAEAARFTIGLCLERRTCRNHELTVSNKIFDYLMGGLAVVTADLPGLRAVVQRSGGGVLFEPGSPIDLARQIGRLYNDPTLVSEMSARARRFALKAGNRELMMARFVDALRSVI